MRLVEPVLLKFLEQKQLSSPYGASPGDILHFPFKGETINVIFCLDKRWRDGDGCIWAFEGSDWYKDPEPKLGVGPLSLPNPNHLNDAAQFHDAAYSNPVYQDYHERKETDQVLAEQLELVSQNWFDRLITSPMYTLVRVFGRIFWENKKTNN